MPKVPIDENESPDTSEGMAALQMAVAHLSTLITGSDALDSKGAFLVAVNAAFFGVFFGALVSSTDPKWYAIVAPAVLMAIVFGVGWWTVRHREMDQFVVPSDLRDLHMQGGYSDHELAWSYVGTIEEARLTIQDIINQKATGVGHLAALTGLHFAALIVSSVVWFS